LKLNLGCGVSQMPGWINVDKMAACAPDELVDLERFPWPWRDNSVQEIRLNHVLEHLGASADTYIGIFKEMWRVCRDGATVTIVVPHPRHDDFLGDPTHVRAVTGAGLQLFSRRANEEWRRGGFANTPLALYHGVDFEIASDEMILDEPWRSEHASGRMDREAIDAAMSRYNNVVKEQRFVLRVIKPA
jgi:hypothetical protein